MKNLASQHSEVSAVRNTSLSARLRESAKSSAISAGRALIRHSIKGVCLLSGIALFGPDYIASRSPIIIARDAIKPLLDGDGSNGSLYYATSVDDGYEFKDRVDKTMQQCEELVAKDADPETTLRLLKALEKVMVQQKLPTAQDLELALDIIGTHREKSSAVCSCYAMENPQGEGTIYGCTVAGNGETRGFQGRLNSNQVLTAARVSSEDTHKFLSTWDIAKDQELEVRGRFMRFLDATGCQKNDECDQVIVAEDLRLGKKAEPRWRRDDSGRWVRHISYMEAHWWSRQDPQGYKQELEAWIDESKPKPIFDKKE